MPVSPVDGYTYAEGEVFFTYDLGISRNPDGAFASGQTLPPGISASQPSNLYWWTADVTNAGVVSVTVSYKNQAGTETTPTSPHHGVIKVHALCQRAMDDLAAEAVYDEVPEDLLAVAQPLREQVIQGMSHAAKFAALRCEIIFMGFWASGYTLGLPTSPVDGYVYAQSEVLYRACLFSTLAPAGGFANGQTAVPSLAGGTLAKRTGEGPLYWWIANLDDVTGATLNYISYYLEGGAETIHGDGILKIYAICQRQSDNSITAPAPTSAPGPSQPAGRGRRGGWAAR